MIKIINGTYGYKNPKTNRLEAKTSKSEPFELDAKREQELIDAGVAERVGATPKQAENEKDGEPALGDMTVKQLTEMAEGMGLTVPKKATKPQLIEMIENANAGHDDEDDDQDDDDIEDQDGDEDAPDLSAQMPE